MHLGAGVLVHLRFKHSLTLFVDLFQFVEILPDSHGKSSGYGGPESGRLPHLGSDNWNADEIGLCLHAEVAVGHAAVDLELLKLMSAVFLHGVENCLGLETDGLEGGSCNVASLRVLRDSEHGTLAVVYPVRCEETTECSDEDQAAVVFHRLGQLGDFV